MKVEICPMYQEVLGQIFTIFLTCRKTPFFQTSTVTSLDDFVDLIDDEELFVLKVDEEVIGFIAVYAPQSFIHHFYILQNFQRRGLGKLLLDFVSDKFEWPLSLKCERSNLPALEFYQKNGWKFFDKGIDAEGVEYILLTYGLK